MGTAAVLNVTPTTAPSDRATEQLVRRLRDDTIPTATKGSNMTADVGGTTAGYVDLADEISSRLILTIAVVVGLSFLLLMVAFRSVLIPLTAGLMNLISIGAAFGVVSAVFEKGWGVTAVGLADEVAIVSFVPLMMFAILFGLSMDYEVFLMTHIKEAWERTRDNTQAVIDGVAHTGRVITSAALIMVSVFFAFVINGDPTVKQFGVGMGVAVAVDATLVRCLLVPAVMTLARSRELVVPALAGPDRPQLLDRGRRVVPRARRGGRCAARVRTRARADANDAGLGGRSMQIRRMFPLVPIAALAVLATSAQASAPGWSTPHTVTPYRVGTYAAGANGQAVQLFGNGAVQTMTAQIRAIKSDATQGSAVGINAGAPGFDLPRVSVNASGRLVAAWTLDTEGTAPIGLAATLGSRSSLPRTAMRAPDRRPECVGCRDRRGRVRQRRRRLDREPSGRARAPDRQGRDLATRSGAAGRDARHGCRTQASPTSRSVSTMPGDPSSPGP